MKSIKKTGRPATGRKGRPMHLYAEDEFIAALDEWRREQPDIPNRSLALRRLTALALEAEAAKKGKKR